MHRVRENSFQKIPGNPRARLTQSSPFNNCCVMSQTVYIMATKSVFIANQSGYSMMIFTTANDNSCTRGFNTEPGTKMTYEKEFLKGVSKYKSTKSYNFRVFFCLTYQSTGLCLCCRRYGDLECCRRFVCFMGFSPSPFPLADAIVRWRSNDCRWKVIEMTFLVAVLALFPKKANLEKQRIVRKNIRTAFRFTKGVEPRRTGYRFSFALLRTTADWYHADSEAPHSYSEWLPLPR